MDFEFPLDRKHRYPLYAGIAFFVGLPALLALGGLAAADEALLAASGIVALILLPFAVFLGYCRQRPRLIVSAAGIELRGAPGSGEARATWAQMEALRLERGSEGFELRQPLDTPLTRRLRTWHGTTLNGARMMPAWPDELVAEMRFLPIDAFAGWFEEGQLRTALRAHAPELMKEFEARRSAAIASALQARKGGAAILFTLLIVVLAIVYASVSGFFDRLAENPHWASFGNGLLTGATVLLALGMCVYALVNLLAVRRHWREGAYFAAALWLLTALMQILLSLAIFGSLLS